MLSDMIPQMAIELMVAKIYTETASGDDDDDKKSNNSKNKVAMVDAPPSTVVAGFLKFLKLLSGHDWAR